MSRSHLRNRYLRNMMDAYSTIRINQNIRSSHNKHRMDEMPKNKPSRFIAVRIRVDKISWLQESTSFGGHSIPKGRHRKVSGILRAKLKEELREQTKSAIDETRLLL